MSKSKNAKKRGPSPIKREEIILKLREHKRATSADLGVSTAFLFTMLSAGLVRKVGKEEVGGKGRPRTIWALSPRGNGIASSRMRLRVAA